jgi:hypothetical protein
LLYSKLARQQHIISATSEAKIQYKSPLNLNKLASCYLPAGGYSTNLQSKAEDCKKSAYKLFYRTYGQEFIDC